MKKGFTLAEVLMPKRTSGMENNILHSRESEEQEPSSKKQKAYSIHACRGSYYTRNNQRCCGNYDPHNYA